ncbi:MAG TPA: hypothetical protein PKJ99_06145 [Thermoanaerobaculales bacterium]|nr:hypothetical protein [Thermoanaerobaculales bacterium]HPA80611.1 hypothetical protein [Thermoanaerobaculales bacterium]HQL30029.1 hypothetical protein [Thermoanaerobaculales bacterium]HQN97561.1 hypothetical protein [Thermoanaerobaculales bacterium]HQP44099.1 hypothetical protein [Thermoanaerobaculales bacterium]
MARLTINISDDRHRALKEAAARLGTTVGRLVEESLESYGVKTVSEAAALVARARQHSRMGAGEAAALAVREARRSRRR